MASREEGQALTTVWRQTLHPDAQPEARPTPVTRAHDPAGTPHRHRDTRAPANP